jgi:hypothetical protein
MIHLSLENSLARKSLKSRKAMWKICFRFGRGEKATFPGAVAKA